MKIDQKHSCTVKNSLQQMHWELKVNNSFRSPFFFHKYGTYIDFNPFFFKLSNIDQLLWFTYNLDMNYPLKITTQKREKN